MWKSLAIIASTIVIILGPAVLILWLRDKIVGRRREAPAERDERLQAWRQRMLQPEIEAVEDYCGGKIPERLIAMYSDQDLVFKGNLKLCPPGKYPKRDSSSWWIDDFVPLTVEDQQWTCDLSLFGRKGCCFAADGMGNFYWVPVDTERKADAPVYFVCHDPWGNEKVAESLEEFLYWPRVATSKR